MTVDGLIDAVLSAAFPSGSSPLCVALVAACAVSLAAIRRCRRTATETTALAIDLERERAALAEHERLACVVSHDLKAPLLRMGLLLDALEDELGPEVAPEGATSAEATETRSPVAGHLARLHDQLGRMDALIDGVLEYHAVGSGGADVEPVDARAVFEEIGETLGIADGRFVIDGSMPILRTLRTPFVQSMSNVVGNAFKYHPAPERATVRVRVAPLGDRWRFSISDDGAGIDPRFHESIFGMFERGRRSEVAGSTGVGLSIVRRCVENAGGAVRVDSSPGGGATFRIDWPASGTVGAGAIDPGPPLPETLRKAARA